MYKKKQLAALVWLLSLAVLTTGVGCNAAANPSTPQRKFNFNPGWKLFPGDVNDAEKIDFDDSGWKNVTTPHAFNEDEAFKEDISNLTTGISWYRKHLLTPRSQ